MNRSSISSSNALILSPVQWVITIFLFVAICTFMYMGWFSWERFEPGKDFRPLCWDERMSDYWSHFRWSRYAQGRYKVFLIGDSVFWGQEVDNDQTISHYLNEKYGKEIFANLGVDGLFQAGIRGLVKYYSNYYDNVLLQFSPYWLFDENRDLRGNIKRFRHPRLVPQFHPDIHYNNYSLNERLSYKLEHYLRIFSLVRHIIVNYYDNMSVAEWMIENPYKNPFKAITFKNDEVMREKRGKGLDWETKEYPLRDVPLVPLGESVQWECFIDTIEMFESRNISYFVLLGPYNAYILNQESRNRLYAHLKEVKNYFEEHSIPYFEAGDNILPSKMFADGAAHLLDKGHDILAAELLRDAVFREWLDKIE
ncbi:MAG: hypothetical protein GH151_11180 [Bacteroidetes bacterium]|nr:hypothetical protein [Bacteroidota bacterium]